MMEYVYGMRKMEATKRRSRKGEFFQDNCTLEFLHLVSNNDICLVTWVCTNALLVMVVQIDQLCLSFYLHPNISDIFPPQCVNINTWVAWVFQNSVEFLCLFVVARVVDADFNYIDNAKSRVAIVDLKWHIVTWSLFDVDTCNGFFLPVIFEH